MQGKFGVEIQINPMKRDESRSWVVICRSIENYVTECTIDYVDAIHADIQDVSSEQSEAWVEHENAPLSTSTDTAHIPTDQRNWVHILAVQKNWKNCFTRCQNT